MSQDVISDALNVIMNAKRAGKRVVSIRKHSKLLGSVLAIAQLNGQIKSVLSQEDGSIKVELGKLNNCGAIKPRFVVKTSSYDKYVSRYLPSRHIGMLVVSTSKGLMTHKTALENNLGGSLIAFIY